MFVMTRTAEHCPYAEPVSCISSLPDCVGFGFESPNRTVMPFLELYKRLANSSQSIQDVDFKFLNIIQFRAKAFPSWLFVILLIFVLLALWLILTHPLPAIISGMRSIAIAVKKTL